MCIKEKRLVEIPSELAYGKEGVDGIPGDSNLMFNVELADIWNPADSVQIEDLEKNPCENPVIDGDFLRYHYEGKFIQDNPEAVEQYQFWQLIPYKL